MMPLGPAPYLKMLTVPEELRASGHACKSLEGLDDGHTEDEADDAADSYNCNRLATEFLVTSVEEGKRTAAHHGTHLDCEDSIVLADSMVFCYRKPLSGCCRGFSPYTCQSWRAQRHHAAEEGGQAS